MICWRLDIEFYGKDNIQCTHSIRVSWEDSAVFCYCCEFSTTKSSALVEYLDFFCCAKQKSGHLGPLHGFSYMFSGLRYWNFLKSLRIGSSGYRSLFSKTSKKTRVCTVLWKITDKNGHWMGFGLRFTMSTGFFAFSSICLEVAVECWQWVQFWMNISSSNSMTTCSSGSPCATRISYFDNLNVFSGWTLVQKWILFLLPECCYKTEKMF